VSLVLNAYLAQGIDLHNIVQEVLGISFMYFKDFDLTQQEALLFAKITPGWNITWNES
jgi:hypothetical protein